MTSKSNTAWKQETAEHYPQIAACGVNYRTAPIEVRERFALNDGRAELAEREFLALPGVCEAVLINTCNRVEVVLSHDGRSDNAVLRAGIERVFGGIAGASPVFVRDHAYYFSGSEAVSHLFRVVSGLDSMILGEPQVFGQVKKAFADASERGATKATLNRLFHRSFTVAKLVRTDTALGRNAVSLAFAAKELACRIFSSLERARVLLIGAGEIGALTLRYLRASGAVQLVVVNRTQARALKLAEELGGSASSLESLPLLLKDADIVVSCATVGADGAPIVPLSAVRAAQQERGGRPQFFVDLGVPRNIEPGIVDLPEVFLYDIDDLQGCVTENLNRRRAEAAQAELLVQQEVRRFEGWMDRRRIDQSIREAVLLFDELKRKEVERTLKRLLGRSSDGGSDGGPDAAPSADEIREALELLAGSLVSKILHGPISALRGGLADDSEAIDLFRKLFLVSGGASEGALGGEAGDASAALPSETSGNRAKLTLAVR